MGGEAPPEKPEEAVSFLEGVTSGANQTAGVPARATVGVCCRQVCSQISAPAHRDYRLARWSHPTIEKLTAAKRS